MNNPVHTGGNYVSYDYPGPLCGQYHSRYTESDNAQPKLHICHAMLWI
jgi:hypothetical protein